MIKVKSFFNLIGKKASFFFTLALACAYFVVPSFAAVDQTVVTNMTTAFTSVKENFNAIVAAIGPIAVGVAGIFIVWRLGVRFFKSIAK